RLQIGEETGRPDHRFGIVEQQLEGRRQLARAALAHADDVQPGNAHAQAPLLMALKAALAIAEPPRRPRTVRNGIEKLSAASKALLSAAPTKPTGVAIIAAGRGAP